MYASTASIDPSIYLTLYPSIYLSSLCVCMCVCIDVYLRLRFSAVEEDTCFDTCLATCGGGYLSLSVEYLLWYLFGYLWRRILVCDCGSVL
jgi:hypothetical protein